MRYSFLAVLVACSLAASAVHAEIHNITFEGEVTNQTCQAVINGQTDAVVMLPTVSHNNLGKEGDTTGETPFTVSITGCSAPSPGGAQKVFLRLNGEQLTTTGHLSNLAVSNDSATGVAIQLADVKRTKIELKGENRVEVGTLAKDTLIEERFFARYVREAGELKAGRVAAMVRYDLSYQ